MKILHVICSTNPQIGGPIEVIRQLAPMYREAGHDVEVACLDSPNEPFVKGFPAAVHALGPGLSRYRYSRRLLPWLRENRTRYDALVVNGIWNYHSFAVWRALRCATIPYVVFTHGMLDPWFKHAYPRKHLKKWMYWPWGDYRVLRDAHAVLFTSEEECRLARQSFWLYKAKEHVVSYGTARPPAHSQAQREAFTDKFPEVRSKRIVLVMGRIHPKKGCDIAITAFSKVLRQDERYQLVFAGPDEPALGRHLRSLAEKLGIADRITWTGMLQNEVKWGALRAAEVLLMPSHQENFGVVVAESLACGVPVLISNKVNIWREILADGAGFVQDDDQEGTERLLETWRDLSDVQKLGMRESALACFEHRFEIHKVASNLLDVLTAATAGEMNR